MTESDKSRNDLVLQDSIPGATVPLESLLCTGELRRRPSRPPGYEKENRALVALASALADSPRTILQTLAETILELTQSESSGVSLLTSDGKRFYWPAIAGSWTQHIGGGTPREFGPCGDVLDRNTPLLFRHFERRYTYFLPVTPLVEECLLVPFYVRCKAVGTIWAIVHSDCRKFDAEDLRLLESIGLFASAAYQAVESIENLKLGMAAREKAEIELRELTDGLETQVQVRTKELERSTRELLATNKELAGQIAERKLAEKRLCEEEAEVKRSEARKTAILDSALDCIVTIDHEGCITEFNPAAERTFGYRRDEVVGKQLADVIVPPSLREQHRQGFARYLATGAARVLGRRMEMTAVRADGSEFPVELAITRIPLDGPPSFTGYVRDITNRKQREEELRRSAAYLAEAQKLSRTGSFGWSVATDEHYWSDETFRIFEYDVSTKVTLQLILDRVHPQDLQLVKQAIASAAEGKDLDFEYRLLMPDDSVKHVHVFAHAISSKSDNREYVGAVMDFTAIRRAEEAVRRAQAELAHVSRVTTLGELTASIAHEVNQPLTAVVNNANACLGLLPDSTPQLQEIRTALAEIVDDADRASAVIARVRQLVRKAPFASTLLNLRDVITGVLALARYESAAHHVTIRTDLTEDLPPVMGDRVQLQQVLLNLVVNGMDAMKTTEETKRILTICGRREMRDGKPEALLSVQDTGIGLKLDEMDRLFEAFFTTKPQGMGMGLAISRSIIEAHGGRLWGGSNQGAGATFLFSLPAAGNTTA